MKRTSITRLKRNSLLQIPQNTKLEMKRTSITRLKHRYDCWIYWDGCCLKWKEPRLRDWNLISYAQSRCSPQPWNEKNLDYEIETSTSENGSSGGSFLKWKEPRLRDWNLVCQSVPAFSRILKWKEPRLRDWNFTSTPCIDRLATLEMKRTSITRLKRCPACRSSSIFRLEMKRTSITRLKLFIGLAIHI